MIPITRTPTKAPAPAVVAPVEPTTAKVFFVRIDDAKFAAETDGFIADANTKSDASRMTRATLTKAAVRAFIRAARANV